MFISSSANNNTPPPPLAATAAALLQNGFTEELTFCLPSEATYRNLVTRFWADIGEHYDSDITANALPCVNLGCNVENIGNGRCDMACYNDLCMYDGNDCGGPPINLASEDPASLTRIDPSLRQSCMVTRAFMSTAPPTGMPAYSTAWVSDSYGYTITTFMRNTVAFSPSSVHTIEYTDVNVFVANLALLCSIHEPLSHIHILLSVCPL